MRITDQARIAAAWATTGVRAAAKTRLLTCLLCWAMLWLLLYSCQTHFAKNDLIGAWKADSVLQYTNGFVERKAVLDADENIVYVYGQDGKLTMKKEAKQRSIQYELVGDDSLVYRSNGGAYLVGYRILALSAGRLVLKKKQHPMFPGNNQEVYEVRQFSPVTATH